VSILAGIDFLTGKVHALVKDRHRSREFIEFLELLDKAYPTDTTIKVILDNHENIKKDRLPAKAYPFDSGCAICCV